MKHLTAMQLMIRYLEDEGLEKSGAYHKAKHLLEVEKEQIVNAFDCGAEENFSTPENGEQYYNETYKNK